MNQAQGNVMALGASGLIGRYLADDLRGRGFAVIGVARKFAPGQKAASDQELPVLSLSQESLGELMAREKIEVVVNCIGVLQDGPGADTRDAHREFVARLLEAMKASRQRPRLIQISIPGAAGDDRTAFSQTKREAERLIVSSGIHYAILRPGFVVAPAAYGGSALLRAIAALPIDLPAAERATPFQPIAIEDVTATVAWLVAYPDHAGVVFDVMQQAEATLGDVVDAFCHSFGTDASRRIVVPSVLLTFGGQLGDVARRMGWAPPICSTALVELRRGVVGDPAPWMAATGIVPATLKERVAQRPASIQDKWFARLFLVKPLIFAALSVFWLLSGFIALFVSYEAAAAILVSHHFPAPLIAPVTIVSSLVDISIGALIAFRKTSAFGLVVGIGVAFGYMTGAALFTPDLWVEPLGALVKTGPAIVLMLVALLMLDNR